MSENLLTIRIKKIPDFKPSNKIEQEIVNTEAMLMAIAKEMEIITENLISKLRFNRRRKKKYHLTRVKLRQARTASQNLYWAANEMIK